MLKFDVVPQYQLIIFFTLQEFLDIEFVTTKVFFLWLLETAYFMLQDRMSTAGLLKTESMNKDNKTH